MIIPVKKYLFIGACEDIEQFFERAQQRGFIEFIPAHGKRSLEPTPDIQTFLAALKILRKQPLGPVYEKRGDRDEALEVARTIIALKEKIEHFHEQERLVTAEIARVAPLGDFSLEEVREIEQLGGRVIQFFCMKSFKRDRVTLSDEMIYLGTEYDLDYFMSIADRHLSFPEMIEMKVEQPVGVLKENLKAIMQNLAASEEKLRGFAGHIDFLHNYLLDDLNHFHLEEAKSDIEFPLENGLFAVEAWIPQNKLQSLFACLQGLAVHCDAILIEEEDRVPTYMENEGFARLGEDLVHIYDTPGSHDRDPSRWVLWSFALFFAMIIADAGYGLLFLALAGFLKWKYPHLQGSGRRFVKLIGLLSISCIVWGVLTTSYFGLEILPENPLNRVSLSNYLVEKKAAYHLANRDDVYQEYARLFPQIQGVEGSREMLDSAVKHENGRTKYPMFDAFKGSVMLEIALLAGVIHIGLSLLRYLDRHLAGLGWLAFTVGGYLYFPSKLHATSLVNFLGWMSKSTAQAVGLELIWVGIGGAVVLALIQKRLKGLSEIMNVITVFGDVLSYLRLYALSLAATIMADTFNGIGSSVGLVFGAIIILAGHCVNISLGTMGGVIHGLRLNFIEWYHYSFEGGGRLLRPLHKLKIRR